MRIYGALAILGLVAACDVAAPIPDEPASFTPVVWKENTPVATRAADRQACELAALGAGPLTTQEQLAELVATTDPSQRKVFVDRCMSNKGYTVTEGRVCTARDRARGQLVIGGSMDALPPLSQVSCFDPAAGGFVIT